MGRKKNDLQENRSKAKLDLYFLESLKNSPAKLDAKNEIESPHPQAYQDPISFLASNFPPLEAVLI